MLKKIFKKNKGFTLIELLVVIAIIGILSGVVIVSVGDAVARARDSRRLADVRQLAFVLEREIALGTAANAPLDGCTTANTLTTTCNGPGTNEIHRIFPVVHDPGDRAALACAPGGNAVCRYSIANDVVGATGQDRARLNSYRICFFLEVGSDRFGAGMHSIRTGSHIRAGC